MITTCRSTVQSRNFHHLKLAFGYFLAATFLPVAQAQSNYATPYYFSTFAGTTGGPGDADGIGRDARFNFPQSAAVDLAGNVYVADAYNFTIRKITPTGTVITFAGASGVKGSVDGPASDARFDFPSGIAVAADNTVYVADGRTIRKILPTGVVTTLAGSSTAGGASTDGNGPDARFESLRGLAVDLAGNIYVADQSDNTIRKITPAGEVSTLAGAARLPGSADGVGSSARFDGPGDIAVDNAGVLYVADVNNCTIRKITPTGVVTTVAGLDHSLGTKDGTGADARFRNPSGIAVDGAGNLYVTDKSNSTIRKIAPGGVVTTFAGTALSQGIADGTGLAARFNLPQDVAVDNLGNLYVADTENCAIRKISPTAVVTTLAGAAHEFGNVDGAGTNARFSFPQNLTVDGAGNIYVADTDNFTIRKISPSGLVTTLAGSAGERGNADGTGASARFDYPQGIAVDNAGNAYVTSNLTVRKITPVGVVTTLAGTTNAAGSADGTGSNARFYHPHGITVDSLGNVYVADQFNCTIRKITPAGDVTTFAGTAGAYGKTDGAGANARFNWPQGLAIDHSDNIYVADTGSALIRKITPTGIVSTLAGGSKVSGGADGVGAAASFLNPSSVSVDGSGNVYVTDQFNCTIRKITPAGETTTLGGAVAVIGSADGTGSNARFYYPGGVAVDQAGNLYVANSGNNNIRKGQLPAAPIIATQPQSQTVTAGGSVQFSVGAAGAPAPTYQWFFNGSAFAGATTNTLSFTNARMTDAGDYSVVVTNSLGSVTSNKATLTVNTSSTPAPSTDGQGSGGGSLGALFAFALLALAASRQGRLRG